MSDEKVIEHMIDYIKIIERKIQAEQMGASDNKIKQKAVGEIIKELEREIKNADQED